jgi:hypothetical protein
VAEPRDPVAIVVRGPAHFGESADAAWNPTPIAVRECEVAAFAAAGVPILRGDLPNSTGPHPDGDGGTIGAFRLGEGSGGESSNCLFVAPLFRREPVS